MNDAVSNPSQMFQLLMTESHVISKYKDTLNGNARVFAADQEKSWFENQVKLDSAFLQELNVLDYSLLLAHQPLHRDERDAKHSLANLVVRTTK